jgi:carbon-monoxide dehydrogenase small subunit
MAERLLINVRVNGRERELEVAVHHTLLEVLRDDVGLTGTKECCVVGECGACTVIIDGRPVNSCLVLAVEADGTDVLTVEGLARGGELHPLQTAFLDHGAAQCGFCIPGQLMSATALLERVEEPSDDQIQEALAGNLCRCAGYEQIFAAVRDAASVGREAAAPAEHVEHPA